MNPYRYSVSVRLRHPCRDLSAASKTLGIKPEYVWKAGAERVTPKGTPLPGQYQESYWSGRLTPSRGRSSKSQDLEAFLEQTIKALAPAKTYISRLRSTGGHAEFFIGLFGTKNFGVELSPAVLSSAAKLGTTLSLDIYP